MAQEGIFRTERDATGGLTIYRRRDQPTRYDLRGRDAWELVMRVDRLDVPDFLAVLRQDEP